MTDDPRKDEQEWEVGWEGHRDAQRRRVAKLSLVEKIRWLEEAQQLAGHLQRSRKDQEPLKP